MSVLYRLFCAYRLQDVIQWQEQVLLNSQFGFRPGHSTDDVFYDISLQIEESLLAGTSLIGVHFDYQKDFDLNPRNILFALAEHLGFCPNLLQVMKHMYTNLQRYFRVPGGVSPAFRSTCGILQGCPLSVIFMNLIISVWARAIEAETDALPRAFADDSMVLAKDIKTAKHAWNITGEFATITGQELAAKKTMAWSTLKSSRNACAKFL